MSDDLIADLHAEARGAPCRYCGVPAAEPCRDPNSPVDDRGRHRVCRVPHASRISDRRRALERADV